MGTSEVQKQAHSSPVPDAQSNESPCIYASNTQWLHPGRAHSTVPQSTEHPEVSLLVLICAPAVLYPPEIPAKTKSVH